MADEELELDVKETKGGNKTIIFVIVGILLLNGIGIGVWIFSKGDKSNTSEKKEVVLGPIEYLTMVPEFIVNFGPSSKVRFLQIDLQISTRQPKSLEIVGTYRPVIRNDILVVLSNVKYEDLKDRPGKEALQKKLLDTINKVVTDAMHVVSDKSEKEGDNTNIDTDENVKGPIENVYYTSFIMQ